MRALLSRKPDFSELGILGLDRILYIRSLSVEESEKVVGGKEETTFHSFILKIRKKSVLSSRLRLFEYV